MSSNTKHNIQIHDNWYILRHNQKTGPYTYTQMIEQVQKDEVMDYQYVWAPHLEQWTIMAEVEDFSKDRLIRLIEKMPEHFPFLDRVEQRAESELKIQAHNDLKFFDGECLSLSKKGGLFLLNEPLLRYQTKVHIHIPSQDKNPMPMNIKGIVKSKKYSKVRLNSKSGLHYIILFDEETQRSEALKRALELHFK